MERSRFRPAVGRRHADQDIVGRRFGIFHKHVEIALAVEDARVQQLELRVPATPATILFEQACVRKFGLRVLVEGLQIGSGGRGVQIEIALLHVFAVVSLMVGQAEQSFLQDWVPAVPEGRGEAETTLAIADAQQTIFSPTVRATTGVIVRKILPG